MTNWGRIVEEQIQNAVEAGAFDDLTGTGEPLNLQDNPHADPAWRLAWHLLQANDFSLPWLEKRRAIEARLAQARGNFRRAARRWREAGAPQKPVDRHAQAWQRALKAFETQIHELNREIFDYNLEVPAPRFQRRQLDLEEEIRKAKSHVEIP